MKKTISSVLFVVFMTVISIFSLAYYTIKFYPKNEHLVFWVVIMVLVIITLLLGVYNAYNNKVLRKQNEELISLVATLSHKMDKNCDKVLESVYNSRDIELDVYNILKEKEK